MKANGRNGAQETKPNRFAEALRTGTPLVFEPIVPSYWATPGAIEKRVRELTSHNQLGGIARLDGVNAAEVIEEEHAGFPIYKTMDPRPFVRAVTASIPAEPITNKVTVHEASAEAFVSVYIPETLAMGIRNIVLVGGTERFHKYPGPSPLEANLLAAASKGIATSGGLLGNISIPDRRGEVFRVAGKILSGADFFTTQILFSSEHIVEEIRQLHRLSATLHFEPQPLLLSFAPTQDRKDMPFVAGLTGRRIPKKTQDYLFDSGPPEDAVGRSIKNALRIFLKVRTVIEQEHLPVPIGVNVEQLTQRNADASLEMLRTFARVIDGDSSSIRKELRA